MFELMEPSQWTHFASSRGAGDPAVHRQVSEGIHSHSLVTGRLLPLVGFPGWTGQGPDTGV